MAAPPNGGSPPTGYADCLKPKNAIPQKSKIQKLNLKPQISYKGELCCYSTEEEIDLIDAPFNDALIRKFTRGRPSLQYLRQHFLTISFKGDYCITALDSRHVRITFDLEKDMHRCWSNYTWNLGGKTMQVLNRTKDFDLDEEPPFAPIWVNVEFSPTPASLGKLLYADPPTEHLSRPSTVRICVEFDLRNPLPTKVKLGTLRKHKKHWKGTYNSKLK